MEGGVFRETGYCLFRGGGPLRYKRGRTIYLIFISGYVEDNCFFFGVSSDAANSLIIVGSAP